MKKAVSLLLALAMILSLAACGGGSGDTQTSTAPSAAPSQSQAPSGGDATEPGEPAYLSATHDAEEIYDMALGDFYEALEKAHAAADLDERYALAAIAEAYLLESGTLLPYYARGGNYAFSSIVPRSIATVNWGSDEDRLEMTLIADKFLTAADRAEIVAGWKERAGTGTARQWMIDTLTQKGYGFTSTYNDVYTTDPDTFDTLSAWTATVSETVCMTMDGLVMYDCENVLQPALAESYEVSADGLTWTFHIRQGVKWVDSQGRELGEVTADDWVAGAQHCMDGATGNSAGSLFWEGQGGNVVNAMEYSLGEITDFSQVGVTAVDDYTLQYTLTTPTPYFPSMLTYCGLAAPMNRSYYQSKGGKFGVDVFDPTAADYSYGKTPNDIAYCGPMLITSWTEKNSFVFKENPTYWNKDNTAIKEINWFYYSGEDVLQSYNMAREGKTAGAGLNSSALELAKADGDFFDTYCYISVASGGLTYAGNLNLNRGSWANYNDATKGVSPQTEEEQVRTHAAMLNQNFRLALALAHNRVSWRAQQVGEELAPYAMRNSYTPALFVTISKDVTVDINGKATTFKAGTYYGQIVQAQLDADGVPILVYNPEADGGAGSGDGYDGWYNPEKAMEYLNKAIEELAADGLEISKEHPIQIDYPGQTYNQTGLNVANAYKQNIDVDLQGLVQINIISYDSSADYVYCDYYAYNSNEKNYDVSFSTGWAADYADPCSYLDTMMPYDGYVVSSLGLW